MIDVRVCINIEIEQPELLFMRLLFIWSYICTTADLFLHGKSDVTVITYYIDKVKHEIYLCACQIVITPKLPSWSDKSE